MLCWGYLAVFLFRDLCSKGKREFGRRDTGIGYGGNGQWDYGNG